jgi:TonB family protein
LLDGTVVTELEGVENPQGFLALRSDSGTVEFRGIVLRDLQPSRPVPPADVFAIGGDVAPPGVRSEVKPRYTADAMRRRIQGTVSMSVVIQPDGTTGDVRIHQSLDPEFGLDEEALTAARQWQFTPGTRNGDPVPVLATIEMTFTLK